MNGTNAVQKQRRLVSKLEDLVHLDREELREEVEVQCVQHHSKTIVMVCDKHWQQPWKKRAVQDGDAEVSCISETMAAAVGVTF